MRLIYKMLLLSVCLLFTEQVDAQSAFTLQVNMGILEGAEVTPDNILSYQVMNNDVASKKVTITGTLVYKASALRLHYSFNTTLQPGLNDFQTAIPNPRWQFSSQAFKELFQYYKKLPQGTYEYCVEIVSNDHNSEQQQANLAEACVYHTVEDMFLINLITPDDDAKLYEYNPMLSWVVNYPFASELTYKLRVVARKEGQNKENALNRNNPVFRDNNVFATGMIYPPTAKPLELNQPYVWTVDAYYKSILLGGAEVWQFTIIEDPVLETPLTNVSYIDVRKEYGNVAFSAVGELKIKYALNELRQDSLYLELKKGDKEIKLTPNSYKVSYGDNRFTIDFKKDYNLKHAKQYMLTIKNSKGAIYKVPFNYINPDFLNPNTKEQK